MKGLRVIKKSRHLYRSVQSQSRQIITNIFANGIQMDQLQLNLHDWTSQHAIPMKIEQNPTVKTQQPIKNLLQLLQHLANDFYIDICSFVFLNSNNIYIVYKEKYITIKKIKFEKSKLKYWLSHIYFTRLRNKLAESLLQQNYNAERQVIHYNQEKQYMPSLVSGGKHPSSTLIRQIKVSRSSIDRRHGQSERQQFCLGYYKNGAQQLFNFSEVLSFVQYPFNLSQISYFKILIKQKINSNLITTFYTKKHKIIQDQTLIVKLKRLLRKQQRWIMLRDEFQEMKNTFIKNELYQEYAHLLMLQIISFLEVKIFLQVKQLQIQWTISTNNNVVLSNASIYKFLQLNKVTQPTQGLVTLYEKCQSNRYRYKTKQKQEQQDNFRRFKKMKSEQKYMSNVSAKLPLLRAHSRSKSKQAVKMIKNKNKANSCVLRLGLNKIRDFS